MLVALLVGCRPSLELEASSPPFEADSAGDFYAEVEYDGFERTTLDLLLPAGDGPFPVVFYIHGGGFTGGDKDAAWEFRSEDAQRFLDEGVAFGSIGYRLLEDQDPDGVLKPLTDAQHGVQFARYYSKDLGIDPDALAVYGTSAGAGAALWLGTHDDLADPDADTRAWRESSRVTAVGALETQASYDLVRWETDVFEEYGITLGLAAQFGLEQRLLDFYAADDVDAIYTDPALQDYRREVDMLDLMDSADAPFYVENRFEPVEFPLDVGVLFHHAYHAREVAEAADAAGLDHVASIPELGSEAGMDVVDFLLEAL